MPCAYEMQRLTLLLKEAMRIARVKNIPLEKALEEILESKI